MKLPLAFGKDSNLQERLSELMSKEIGKPVCLVVSPLLYDPMTFVPRFTIMEEIADKDGTWFKKFETLGHAESFVSNPDYINVLVAELINEYTTQEKFK